MDSLIEEIQVRANRMEDGLSSGRRTGYEMWKLLSNDKKRPTETELKKLLNDRWKFKEDE